MKKTIFLIVTLTAFVITSCETGEKKQMITTSQEVMIDNAPGSCPFLTKDNKNNLVLSWIKQLDSSTSILCYAISTNEGKNFSEAIEIPGSTNVHPHGENLPKIIFKPSGEIVATWGALNPSPQNAYSGLVFYSQSFDGGATWSKPKGLTKDPASVDQRYFDVALLPGGEAAIVWLDNRKKWNKEGSGLYYATTKGNDGFQDERLIGGPCCQCCRTDLFIDRNNNIHVLYRAIINDSIRDMAHIVSVDYGKTFTSPIRISQDNWVMSGCPHTGPAIAENKEGIHFTWFTGGSNSGIYYNRSKDNGKTFTERDSVSGKASKHCQITSMANDNVVIVWNESFPDGKKFRSRIGIEERTAKGKTINQQYITDEKGNASFPVIIPVNSNKAVVAYTQNIFEKQQVFYKPVTFQ